MGAENYEIQECVGKGTFGDVYKAISTKDQELVAIKVINLDDTTEEINVIVQEIQFLSRLRTPYITKYMETFINGVSMWIVMEFCGGGSCADLLKCHKKLNEDVTAYIIRDVLRGLEYLHGEKKVHRDIKLANILLTNDGKIKLADFGVSGEITMTHLKRNTFVGTPFWMAPEVIIRKSGYNEKADIWSTGITTIELVTGSPPLAEHNPLKILFEIPKKKPPLLTGIGYSENIKDFVKYCLIKDPTKRPSSELLLHHKFVKSVRRHVNLIQLIQEKDVWYSKHKVQRTPKNNLNFEDTSNFQRIQWNFTTRSERKFTPMEQTLMSNFSAYENLEDKENVLQQSLPNGLSPSEGLPNEVLPAQGSLSPQSSPGQNLSPGNVLGLPGLLELSPETPISSPGMSSNDVLIYCLERVKQRAVYPYTREAVSKLLHDIISYEYEQPGISDAILEEILKFNYPVDK